MKNSITSAALGLLAALGLASCSGFGGSGPEMTYLPVKTDKSSHWGMVGPDGKLLFEDEFEEEPTPVFDGVFTVKESKGYAVYAADAKPRIIGDLENLVEVGIMSEGVIPATRKGERIGYYKADGKLAFTLEPVNNKEIVQVASHFTDGIAVILDEDGNYGAINSDGKVIIEPKYAYLSDFSDGLAVASPKTEPAQTDSVAEPEDITIFVNKKGEELVKLRDVSVYGTAHSDMFAGEKNDRCGFFNKKGEFKKMPEKVKAIGMFNSKYFTFCNDDGKWGVMDMDGEIVVRPKYEGIMFLLSGDKFLCKSDNKKTYIVNTSDERITTFEDINVIPMDSYLAYSGYHTDFGFIGEEEHSVSFYNEKGESTIKNDFYEMGLRFNQYVMSDYLNIEGAAEKLAFYIGDNSYDKVAIGTPISKYVTGEPRTFTRSDRYYFPNLNGGYRYNLNGYAYTDKYIAIAEPVYTTRSYGWYSYQVIDHYNYKWDQTAMVDRIHVDLSISVSGVFSKVKEAVVNAIKAKGFAVTKSEKAYAILSKGDTRIFVAPANSSSSDVTVDMYSASGWDSVADKKINSANNNYPDEDESVEPDEPEDMD